MVWFHLYGVVHRQRGQVLFESFVSISVFFVFIFGILYLTLCYQTKLWLHHISYETAVCLQYSRSQDQCVRNAKHLIARAFPYLSQVNITIRSYLSHQESLIQALFPGHILINARESFYAKY